eukprot:TRINITY_DN12155_c0_g1_i1.p1 TRINITY_DN12155_c0_g1~~TRINITY_DN12155_c0_g1_i1.p1  ORF type:complete len:342 (-),score=62.05 TRINITY_DN12155_c0_g1_i1:24-1007(-)
MEGPSVPPFGIVFDIDGVLMKSDKGMPEAIEAFKRLPPNTPFLFMTNGGGTPEETKMRKLVDELGLQDTLMEDQFLCSHSPKKDLVEKYATSRVLVVGKDRQYSKHIMESYGFKNFVLLDDFAADRPYLVPWKKYAAGPGTTLDNEPIKAIFQLHEPTDWAEGLQIISDVLQSNGVVTKDDFQPSSEQVVELYVANPDFTYAAHFHKPRYTSGAFVHCLKALYKESCGRELRCTIYGKPFTDLFELAQRSLEQKLAKRSLDAIYMIGDNPKSDIQGANTMGGKWFSILVRTGVFKGRPGDNDSANPAKLVCDHVDEAIKFILKKHGY